MKVKGHNSWLTRGRDASFLLISNHFLLAQKKTMVELVRFCVFILNNSTQNCTIPFVWIHSSTMQPFRWDDLFGGLGVLYEYLLELNHVLANKIKWKKNKKKNILEMSAKNNNLTRESGRQIQRYVACKHVDVINVKPHSAHGRLCRRGLRDGWLYLAQPTTHRSV